MMKRVLGGRAASRLVSFLLMFSLLFCQLPMAAWAEDAQPAGENIAVVEVIDETTAADVEENVADEQAPAADEEQVPAEEETPAVEDEQTPAEEQAPVVEEQAPVDNAVMPLAETGAGEGETAPSATHGYIQNIEIVPMVGQLPEGYTVFEFDPETSEYDIIIPDVVAGTCKILVYPSDNAADTISIKGTGAGTNTSSGKPVVDEMTVAKLKALTGAKKYQLGSGNKSLSDLKLGKPQTYTITAGVKDENGSYTETDTYKLNLVLQTALSTFAVATADGTAVPISPIFSSISNIGKKEYSAVVPEQAEQLKLTVNRSTKSWNTNEKFLVDCSKITVGGKDVEPEVIKNNYIYTVNLADFTPGADGVTHIPFAIVYTGDEGKGYGDEFTLNVTKEDHTPVITQQPQSVTAAKDTTPTLTVAAEQPNGETAGTLTYQWYSARFEDSVSTAIAGATSASYTLPALKNAGTVYYYCEVCNTVNGLKFTAATPRVPVTTELTYLNPCIVSAEINGDVQSEYYTNVQVPLKTELSKQDDIISYPTVQWYRNTTNSNEGGTLLGDAWATGGTAGSGITGFTVSEPAAGTYYYYCVVTLYDPAGKLEPSVAKTEPIAITFKAYEVSFEGEGTEADPYKLSTPEDLTKLANYVKQGMTLEGLVFQMTQDIELPAGWEPIGTLKAGETDAAKGINIQPFSGIFDGGGHKLTVPKNGRPLFGYLRRATVRNMDLYGEKILGCGLLENYVVDYDTDGEYNTGCPFTVNIDRVNILAGTHIQQSGFLGGPASGANTVTITNCTAAEGVVLGCDGKDGLHPEPDNPGCVSVGTFAGSFNGTVSNCVSYATVNGDGFVGGIIGAKGQSMGLCKVQNCAFLGSINAASDFVGGIIGGGYAGSGSAPNTPVVTIRNCVVAADIKGADCVGGILGGEPDCENCWDNGKGYIQDNVFAGNITATGENVGAIVGFFKSFNENQGVTNCYYLNDCGAAKAIGGIEILFDGVTDPDKSCFAVSDTEMAGSAVVDKLNASDSSFKNWTQGADGYPVHSDEPVAYELTIGGEYKTEYYIGDELDLIGITFTVKMSDGTKVSPTLDEVKIEGYDKNTRAVQTLTAIYGAAKAEFTVTVLKRPATPSDPNKITVYLTLLGDTAHGDPTDATTHTLKANNLETWIAKTAYTVDLNATVWDVLQQALVANNMTCSNPSENYVESITRGGVELGEFTNGNLSGWMYTLNGKHPELGVSEQFLDNGDKIVFHYTDDYTKEQGSEKWNSGGSGGGAATVEKTEQPGITAPQTDKNGFTDVSDHWGAAAIDFVVEQQLFNGTSATTFEPDANMSRAMLATVLWRLAEQPQANAAQSFSDIANGQYYTDAVAWASDKQIVTGYEDGSFAPNRNITREELAAMLYRYAKAAGLDANVTGDLTKFADGAEVSTFANEAMQWAVGSGLMNGKENNTLDPQGNATRAEVATTMQRLVKLLAK